MKRTDHQTKVIRTKILNNGFQLEELLSLKKTHKYFKEIHNKKLTRETNFQHSITLIAYNALKSLRDVTLITLILLVLAIYFHKEFILTFTISFSIIALSTLLNAREKGCKLITELKLIKLALRLIF